jgi:predicted small secreted protein
MKTAKTCCVLCLALCLTVSISACNTISGAGEDIKAAGNAIENAAKKTKEKISN